MATWVDERKIKLNSKKKIVPVENDILSLVFEPNMEIDSIRNSLGMECHSCKPNIWQKGIAQKILERIL